MDTSRIQEIILKVNGNDAEKTIKMWILHLQPTPDFSQKFLCADYQ